MNWLIETALGGVAVFVAIRAPYAWYWQVVILVALFLALNLAVSAVRVALASLNRT